MNILQKIRNLFVHGEKQLTGDALNAAFLESAAKLAGRGYATVYNGSMQALNDAILEHDTLVYVLVIREPHRIANRNLVTWFRNYKIGDKE